MGLSATIVCESVKIVLPENVLSSYYFDYDLADNYVKVYPNYVGLHLEIDVYALLSNDEASFAENEQTLANIRAWGKHKFGDAKPENQYYRDLTLIHTLNGKEFREIGFGSAYVEGLSEVVEPEIGKHIIELRLLQKEDKLDYEGQF